MASNTKIGIDLSVNDQTAKGVKSAQKGFASLGKAADKVNRVSLSKIGSSTGVAAFGGTLGQVEKSLSRTLGGTSVAGKVSDRLGGIAEAGRSVAASMSTAAGQGNILSRSLGVIGVAAGSAAGVLAAAGAAALKFGSAWASGGASVGRAAQSIGIAADQLQALQGAAQRAGVDKDSATGALGGVAETLNDARYGRNPMAMAALAQLKITPKSDANGNPDTIDFLKQLSSAIVRTKNAQAQNREAGFFGAQALLPLLRQGPGAIASDMVDVGRYGGVTSNAGIKDAMRVQRKAVVARQLGDRAAMIAGQAGAGVEEAGLDTAIGLGRATADGGSVAGRAVGGIVATAGRAISMAAKDIERGGSSILVGARELVSYLEGRGLSGHAAVGMAANAYAESGFNAHRQQRGGPAFGLFQWEGPRRRQFQQWAGHDLSQATWQEQADFAAYELSHGQRGAGLRLASARSDAEAGAIASRFYERPKDADGQASHRAGVAAAIGQRIDLHVHGLPHHTKVTAKSTGGAVAVAHAMMGDGP